MHPNIQLVSSALLCMANLGAQFGPLLLPQLGLLIERLNGGLTVERSSAPNRCMITSPIHW